MPVDHVIVEKEYKGQRLDNYLFRLLKGVPKSRIYRAIRGGEVRINGKRSLAESRICEGDVLRIPPIRQSESIKINEINEDLQSFLENRVLIENKDLILINKPSGLPVHGGSGVSLGLIEALRQMRPHNPFLELAHRLDRETSGCLLIAKKRTALIRFHEWFRGKELKKRYWVLVKGQWTQGVQRCDLPLVKNQLQSGERMVHVDRAGKAAITIFRPIKIFRDCSLLEATLKTGRTHQIRVHLKSMNYPIAGDDKYGDREFNKLMLKYGLKRMFLQCMELSYRDHETLFGVCAMLDEELKAIIHQML